MGIFVIRTYLVALVTLGERDQWTIPRKIGIENVNGPAINN